MANHITITPAKSPVTITAGDTTLGTTSNALELKEGSSPAVLYVPRADIDMTKLHKTTRSSTCPWKGAASYYSIHTATGTLENAVWSYEAPLDAVAPIAGHLAFYPDKVTLTRR
jgi:uncharacterized protein (DUF427 family)